MIYFLQSNANVEYSFIVTVINVLEGDFTLQYEPVNKFKLDNTSNSDQATVTVPEVRIHNGF